jgi:tripartite-type tricarboxylate transporter receptor subunit TctC
MQQLGRIGLILLLSFSAHAQQPYPSKPIRLVVPFAAGGTTDVLARTVGQKLAYVLGQQVLIDNRPGANGNIGTDLVAKAEGDGYTLVMSFDGTIAINPHVYRKLPFDPQKDLVAVANVARVPLLIVVHPEVPASSIGEFIAFARDKPGAVNYSSAGYGSTGHLTGELLKARAGIDMVHVNYKGGGQAVQDLLGGRIQMLVTGLPTVEGHLAGKRLRPLVFTSTKRVSRLPAVPTLVEAGFPGFEVASWYGIFAPATTPRDVVRTLNAALGKLLAQADMQEYLASIGAEPVGGTPEQFAETVKTDTARWATVVKQANLQLD